jgi:hypothetical protein
MLNTLRFIDFKLNLDAVTARRSPMSLIPKGEAESNFAK